MVAAAIVGGGLKASGVDVPIISSITRQVLLGAVGIMIIALGAWDVVTQPFISQPGPSDEPQPSLSESVRDGAERTPAADPTSTLPRGSRRLTASDVRVSASSVLAPQASFNYRPINVIDGDPGTAWAEGADGPGVGEWLDFDFTETVDLIAIEFLNGYNRTRETFRGNGRVRLITITTDDNDIVATLDDNMEYQTIEEPFGRTGSARMTIESVYRGERFDDTLVSEVAFVVRE